MGEGNGVSENNNDETLRGSAWNKSLEEFQDLLQSNQVDEAVLAVQFTQDETEIHWWYQATFLLENGVLV